MLPVVCDYPHEYKCLRKEKEDDINKNEKKESEVLFLFPLISESSAFRERRRYSSVAWIGVWENTNLYKLLFWMEMDVSCSCKLQIVILEWVLLWRLFLWEFVVANGPIQFFFLLKIFSPILHFTRLRYQFNVFRKFGDTDVH